MREFSAPATVAWPVEGSLTDAVARHAADTPHLPLLSRGSARDGWQSVTAAGFTEEVAAVARGLIASGIDPGDRVAVLSRTRYEWTLFDYALWWVGAVPVPIYETTAVDDVGWILRDSGAVAAVVEHRTHAERVEQVRGDLAELRHVWVMDDDSHPAVAHLVAVGAVGADASSEGAGVEPAEVERRRAAVGVDDLATLLYTSGTTGPPKGCMVTHGNLMAGAALVVHELRELFEPDQADAAGDDPGPGPATLLFLPLPHVFARQVQVACLTAGVQLGHSPDVARLDDDLRSFAPTFVLGVPRFFEKLFTTASQRATADGRGNRFERAADSAIAFSRSLDGSRVPWRRRARRRVLDQRVHRVLREALGGRCRYAISGGAPLGERLGHFYRGAGLTVLEGYGLSETSAAVTVNLPDAQKVGTVGRPLPGTAVRVADDGELWVRGPQVFAGYWHAEEATAAILEPDGWLHTGDVGEVDDEGFVRVTGRKQEILVTTSGKAVSPTALEDRLRAHPLIENALVVGDRRPFVAALVTLDREEWPVWAQAHDRPAAVTAIAGLVDDPVLRAEIQVAVDAANAAVSQAEAIRAFAVLPDVWSEETGELTPSLKLKRSVVLRACTPDIAELYR